jgi:hypothetical protein
MDTGCAVFDKNGILVYNLDELSLEAVNYTAVHFRLQIVPAKKNLRNIDHAKKSQENECQI